MTVPKCGSSEDDSVVTRAEAPTAEPPAAQAQVLSLAQARAERLLRAAATARHPWDDAGPAGRRALVISDPPEGAGNEPVSAEQVGELHALGYAVSVLAVGSEWARGPGKADSVACVLLDDPAAVGLALQRAGGFDLVLLHGAGRGGEHLQAARRCVPGARLLFSPAAAEEPERLADACAAADIVLARSAQEAEAVRGLVATARVRIVPRSVPLRRAGTVPRFAERSGIAVLAGREPGGLDASRDFVHALTPHLRAVLPGIDVVLLAGDRASGGSMADALDGVRLAVAPPRNGAGLSEPVLLSLGARVPCIMTAAAGAELALTPALQDCVAEGLNGVAAAIGRLYRDEHAWNGAARAGAAMLRRHHSAAVMLAALAGACGQNAHVVGLTGSGRR